MGEISNVGKQLIPLLNYFWSLNTRTSVKGNEDFLEGGKKGGDLNCTKQKQKNPWSCLCES